MQSIQSLLICSILCQALTHYFFLQIQLTNDKSGIALIITMNPVKNFTIKFIVHYYQCQTPSWEHHSLVTETTINIQTATKVVLYLLLQLCLVSSPSSLLTKQPPHSQQRIMAVHTILPRDLTLGNRNNYISVSVRINSTITCACLHMLHPWKKYHHQ